jgi:hypothetical protein
MRMPARGWRAAGQRTNIRAGTTTRGGGNCAMWDIVPQGLVRYTRFVVFCGAPAGSSTVPTLADVRAAVGDVSVVSAAAASSRHRCRAAAA